MDIFTTNDATKAILAFLEADRNRLLLMKADLGAKVTLPCLSSTCAFILHLEEEAGNQLTLLDKEIKNIEEALEEGEKEH